MISEPTIVFANNASAGRKLSVDRDWLFCDGSTSTAVMTAAVKAFRKGLKGGIVLPYSFASMGLRLHRPGNTTVLIGTPSQADISQAINTAGNGKLFHLESIELLRTSHLGKHKCRCPLQTINLRGCQCGGV